MTDKHPKHPRDLKVKYAVAVAAVAGICSAIPAGAEEVGIGVGPNGVTVGEGHGDRDRDRAGSGPPRS